MFIKKEGLLYFIFKKIKYKLKGRERKRNGKGKREEEEEEEINNKEIKKKRNKMERMVFKYYLHFYLSE